MPRSAATLISLLFLVGLATFTAGGFAALSGHATWDKVDGVKKLVTSMIDTGQPISPDAYSQRDPNAGSSFHTVHKPQEITPGLLAVTRLDTARSSYVTELIDTDGTIQHSWLIDYPTIVGSGPSMTFPHGVKPLADGSLLVNFDLAYALARLDACGKPLWARTDGVYHHEISSTGNEFWTWFGEAGRVYDGNELVRFDPETGTLEERIHLVDDVILASDQNRIALAIGPDHVFDRGALIGKGRDDFHPNDGTPLPTAIADAFPMFNAGDLLISLRNVNMIAVVDRQTKAIKWHRQGPWIWQHDPDWHADGTISVFGNNPARLRSQIYVVDPASGTVSAPLEDGAPFFTDIMGSHQRLPSGNWLITANRTGRVLEVTATGELVREIHNIINDDFSALIVRSEWLPADYFDVIPSCGG